MLEGTWEIVSVETTDGEAIKRYPKATGTYIIKNNKTMIGDVKVFNNNGNDSLQFESTIELFEKGKKMKVWENISKPDLLGEYIVRIYTLTKSDLQLEFKRTMNGLNYFITYKKK